MTVTDFRNVISNVADSIVIVDQEGIMRFANPSAQALFGRSLEELLGKPFGFPRIKNQATEIEVISKSGELHTAEMRMTETVWEGKRAYLASIRDFTELKRLEHELREKGHVLAERVKELTCLYSISKLIERPRVSFEEIARDIMALILPGWQYPDITCARIILNGQAFTTENFKETNWKQTSDIFVHGKQAGVLEVNYLEERPESDEGPFSKEERNLIDAIAERLGRTFERIKAEEALRESETKYRRVSDNSPAVLYQFMMTPDGASSFSHVSDVVEATIGISAEEIMKDSSKILGMVHPEDQEMFREGIMKSAESLESFLLTFRCMKDGGVIWMEARGTPAPLADGGMLWDGFLLDITDRKRMEEELLKIKKFESLGVLAGGIAHEFNNALTAITGHTELLEMDYSQDEKILNHTKTMMQSAHRMAHLTSQLLAYAGGGKYNPRPMSLSELVADTLPLLLHTLDPDICVETDLQPDVMNVKVDRTQMQMVLSALMTNASEAIDPPGRIKISTRNMAVEQGSTNDHPGLRPGPYVILSIEDDGKGMDKETTDRIFDPFFTTHFIGRGLGMASVYGIVTNHNGNISVDSEPGKGTTVTIYLPALEAREEVEAEVGERIVSAPAIDLPTGEATVLVIEDEEPLVKLFRKILEMLGYRVLEAMTGEEAVELAKTFNGQIDLALLDIKLPDMGGKQVYPLIMEARPHLKVIVCSGYALDGPAQEILDAGAEGFVQKPFLISTLAEKLKEVLEGRTTIVAPVK